MRLFEIKIEPLPLGDGAFDTCILAPTALELGALRPHLLILEPPLFVSHTSFLGNDPCYDYRNSLPYNNRKLQF